MKKLIVSALLVTGALLAQTAAPAQNPPADQPVKKAKKHSKRSAKKAKNATSTAPEATKK